MKLVARNLEQRSYRALPLRMPEVTELLPVGMSVVNLQASPQRSSLSQLTVGGFCFLPGLGMVCGGAFYSTGAAGARSGSRSLTGAFKKTMHMEVSDSGS